MMSDRTVWTFTAIGAGIALAAAVGNLLVDWIK